MQSLNITKDMAEKLMRHEVALTLLLNVVRSMGGNSVILKQVEQILAASSKNEAPATDNR